MSPEESDNLSNFLSSLDDIDSKQLMNMVSQYLSDEQIEIFVDHIEDFYGIEGDEELGTLAQIMITGYLCGMKAQGK
jgi:hypothetical protein